MAICIVIPTINNGNGWGSSYCPPELRPISVIYRGVDNPTLYVKIDYSHVKDAVRKLIHQGHRFYPERYRQDDSREWEAYKEHYAIHDQW
jgi:hypothetical protein